MLINIFFSIKVNAQFKNSMNFKYGREIHHDLDLKSSHSHAYEIEYSRMLNEHLLFSASFSNIKYSSDFSVFGNGIIPSLETTEFDNLGFFLGYNFFPKAFSSFAIGVSQGFGKQVILGYDLNVVYDVDIGNGYFLGPELIINSRINKRISLFTDVDFLVYPYYQLYGYYRNHNKSHCNCDGFISTLKLGIGYNFDMK